MNTCIIDFRQVRPQCRYASSGTSYMQLRLCAQVWPNGQGSGRMVDCCRCEAMKISPELPVISMADLAFGHMPQGVSEEQAEDAARIFAANLRQEIGDVELVCIIPDVTSDFKLTTVRNQLKANFSSVDFLPVSIGVVLDWEERTDRKVADKELVVVADATPEGIYLTPVQAVYDKGSERMVWERHPGELIPAKAFLEKIRERIKNCHFPELFFDFPGWNGLASEAGKLTLFQGTRWYELQEQLSELFSGLTIKRKDLEHGISKLKSGITDNNPTLLCATELLSWDKMDSARLCTACDGGWTWAARQRREPETMQWYDYLPELSVEVLRKGRFELFPLVSRENRRIEPHRGRAVELRIPKRFTLPPGVKSCSFPLFRGNGGTALRFTTEVHPPAFRFTAEVHSPAFPLSKKEECRLKLTYTYGAPKPYQLTFEGSFGTASTTWRPVPEQNPDTPGAVPDILRNPFSKKTLRDFLPSPEAVEHIDLLQAAINALRKETSGPTLCKFDKVNVNKDGQLNIYVKHGHRDIVCSAQSFFETLPENISKGDEVYVAKISYVARMSYFPQTHNISIKSELLKGSGITFTAPLSPYRMQPSFESLFPTFQPVVVIKKSYKEEFGPGVLVDYHGQCVFVPKSSYTSFLQLDRGTQLYCVILPKYISEKIALGAFLSSTPPRIPLTNHYQQKKHVLKRENSNKYFYPSEFSNLPWILCKIYYHRDGDKGLPSSFLDEFREGVDAILSETHNLSGGDAECMDSIAVSLCVMGAGAPEAAWKRMKRSLTACMRGYGGYIRPWTIAMALGNLSCSWQQEMLDEVCGCMESHDMSVRQTAFKVFTYLLLNLRQCDSISIRKITQIIHLLRTELDSLLLNDQGQEEISPLVRKVQDACVLLCLILEFRNSRDRGIRTLLCVNSPLCQDLLILVKKLNNRLVELRESGVYIGKEVCSPSTYEGMNVKLHNLYVLLCGDADSARVSIEDVMEEDSASDVFGDDDDE